MSLIYFSVILIFFILTELLYFRIAKHYEILDIPNHRSAHQKVTIRGVGIVFLVSTLTFFFINNCLYPYFTFGMLLISSVSFIDDIYPLPNRNRILAQLLSVSFLVYELFGESGFPGAVVLVLLLILFVGIINAYNFMDGINGITGAYSLLTIASLYYIDVNIMTFIEPDFLILIGLSLIVFLYFNFRKNALGFCGDVGSIGMAFIVIFGIASLIKASGEWKYLFFLSLYGIDTIYTLIYRLSIKEDIFSAHKLHFYQLLVHTCKWGHLKVAMLYLFTQLLINICIIQEGTTLPVYIIPVFLSLLSVHIFRNKQGKGIRFTE